MPGDGNRTRVAMVPGRQGPRMTEAGTVGARVQRLADSGQPGPFSLGAGGVLEEAYRRAGFRNVVTETIAAPFRMASAAECLRFDQDSFGALHQMMSGLSDTERTETWAEIEAELRQFKVPDGFEGPCEMIVGIGVK